MGNGTSHGRTSNRASRAEDRRRRSYYEDENVRQNLQNPPRRAWNRASRQESDLMQGSRRNVRRQNQTESNRTTDTTQSSSQTPYSSNEDMELEEPNQEPANESDTEEQPSSALHDFTRIHDAWRRRVPPSLAAAARRGIRAQDERQNRRRTGLPMPRPRTPVPRDLLTRFREEVEALQTVGPTVRRIPTPPIERQRNPHGSSRRENQLPVLAWGPASKRHARLLRRKRPRHRQRSVDGLHRRRIFSDAEHEEVRKARMKREEGEQEQEFDVFQLTTREVMHRVLSLNSVGRGDVDLNEVSDLVNFVSREDEQEEELVHDLEEISEYENRDENRHGRESFADILQPEVPNEEPRESNDFGELETARWKSFVERRNRNATFPTRYREQLDDDENEVESPSARPRTVPSQARRRLQHRPMNTKERPRSTRKPTGRVRSLRRKVREAKEHIRPSKECTQETEIDIARLPFDKILERVQFPVELDGMFEGNRRERWQNTTPEMAELIAHEAPMAEESDKLAEEIRREELNLERLPIQKCRVVEVEKDSNSAFAAIAQGINDGKTYH